MVLFNKRASKRFITNYKNILAVLLLSSTLFSCSSTDDEDPSKLVAELSDINEKFDPDVLWEESVGNGSEDYFSRLKPVVAYDTVYSASRAGDVIALDVETGDERWIADLSDVDNERSFWDSRVSAMLAGGPVAGLNKIFVGSENGKIYALDAQSGELVWQADIKGEIISAPAVDSGVVVVNAASGLMKAFNAENGEEIGRAHV